MKWPTSQLDQILETLILIYTKGAVIKDVSIFWRIYDTLPHRFFSCVPPLSSKNRSSPEKLGPPLLGPLLEKLGPPLQMLGPRGPNDLSLIKSHDFFLVKISFSRHIRVRRMIRAYAIMKILKKIQYSVIFVW